MTTGRPRQFAVSAIVGLTDALEAADKAAGKTFVKPAGSPAKECFCIPSELWEQVRSALADYKDAK
jgi:ABC-type proline/glycine betaine transport system substrate-binding protein